VLGRMILRGIRFYQRGISPYTAASCRFTPTCSEYAAVAVERYGAGRGGWLAFKRLLRCRPFAKWGHDPVPEEVDVAHLNRRGSVG
jgi:putative membrane protein insertion efficiency factor